MFWIWTFTERIASPQITTSDSPGFKSWSILINFGGILNSGCLSQYQAHWVFWGFIVLHWSQETLFLHLTFLKSECILQLEWAAPFSFWAVCENNRASYHMLDVVKLDKWDTMYKAFSVHRAHSPGESSVTIKCWTWPISLESHISRLWVFMTEHLMREAQEPEFTKRKEVPRTALRAHPQASRTLPPRRIVGNSLHTAQSDRWVPWAPATSSERRCSRRFHGSRGRQYHLPWL